jgi:hypothetical protein
MAATGGSAVFSPCRTWRYSLSRLVDAAGHGTVNFILLNPSTADETVDDPTIRRCRVFAQAWGYRWLVVTNLFAYRATDPAVMKLAADPIGPGNDAHIRGIALNAAAVVAAWGVHGCHRGRDAEARALLEAIGVETLCLGTTRGGHPRHPLYQRAGTATVVFERRGALAGASR